MIPRIALAVVISLLITIGVSAQKRSFNTAAHPVKSAKHIHDHAREMEFVFYPTVDDMCSDEVTSFGLDDAWGFLAGNNEFGDKEKAQLLEFTGSAEFQVIGVGGFFVMSSVIGDANLTAKVYMMDDATGGPGQQVSTSMPLKVSELVPPSDTAVLLTLFSFAVDQIPVVDYASFFAAIDFSESYNGQDTVGLFHTMEECGVGTDTWEKWVDDTWNSLAISYNPPLNIDFLINAVVQFDNSTTSDQYIANKGLQLYPASPNPAITRTTLSYGLEATDQVEIQIFDSQGKLMESIHHDAIPAGRHEEVILVHDFAPGTYYYRIATSKGQLMSRFLVQQ